jgi:L-rhamnose isomerase / sugar isomerase
MNNNADSHDVLDALRVHTVEIPSWGFGQSGTRFATHRVPGQATSLDEKIEDAALVARYTGTRLRLSLHMPWDTPDDWAELGERLRAAGLEPGTVNPNLFGDSEYRLGSIANPDAGVRRQAISHLLESVSASRALKTRDMWVWVPDGTNYPGQGGFRERRGWVREALRETYNALGADQRLLIEYKLFEPAVYHMDVADWGQALLLCQELGERAQVAVDIGHHAHGVNIEQIAATLLDERRLGSFDLNDRKYADDDTIVGSANPFQLFLVFVDDRPSRKPCPAQDRHRVSDRGQDRRDDPVRARCADGLCKGPARRSGRARTCAGGGRRSPQPLRGAGRLRDRRTPDAR